MLSSQLHLALLLDKLGSGNAAHGAAEILGQLIGGMDVATNRTYKLLHNKIPPKIIFIVVDMGSCGLVN
jgi:hypothetical protein